MAGAGGIHLTNHTYEDIHHPGRQTAGAVYGIHRTAAVIFGQEGAENPGGGGEPAAGDSPTPAASEAGRAAGAL